MNDHNQNGMVRLFKNHDFGCIRTIVIDGEVWFVGKDVSAALGYSAQANAIKKHVREEDKRVVEMMTNGGKQRVIVINEPGMYSLTLLSKLPSAQYFQRWITHDVIPAAKSIVCSLEHIHFSGEIDGLVYAQNGLAVTTSRKIASIFLLDHSEVLKLIDNKRGISDSSAQFCTEHITEKVYYDAYECHQIEYELDEAGFSYMALDLITTENNESYISYINAFVQMQNALNDMFKARIVERVLPQDNRQRQCVYVIENMCNGAIKIGVAHNPEVRLQQLQTGSVDELRIVYTSYVCSNAFNVESIVHQYFSDKHIRGEWYLVDVNDAITMLEKQNYVLHSEFNKHLSLPYQSLEESRQ